MTNTETEHNSLPPHTERLLDHINSPEDLRRLDVTQLPQVASELRSAIVDTLSVNPGHFASSMGAVELTLALHYVFNTPDDRIVWDVGHQAYAHKLLTGRKEQFSTLRMLNGLSGFPNPQESKYDTFTAGHASNSISAALGMAIADMNTPGHQQRKTVAVIGDASISGGLAFEGLNNVSNNPNNLLIVLNDNDMSIDDNVGALHRYLTELTTSEGYNRIRHRAYNALKSRGLINEDRRGRLLRLNNSLKSFISEHQNIFEGLNIRYFGPIDGHDTARLVRVLREIKDMQGPRLLHIRTVKGKGFAQAEKNPAAWHAPGKFDPHTGEKIKKKDQAEPLLWQQVFGKTLVELAEQDDRVHGITAAMPSGTSISEMMAAFPKRAFDVGISEGHAVTFAGGLASGGKRPFVAIYSSFLQRAYDNVIHDVAIQGLPVTFCIDRAGIVGEDGVTHHGLFDMCYLSCIPGMHIASPMDECTLRSLMYTSLQMSVPFAIRYPRGKATTPDWRTPMTKLEAGKGRHIAGSGNADIAILSIGPEGNDALEAHKRLQATGIETDVYDMIWLKPLDEDLVRQIASSHSAIITVEDGSISGGLGAAVRRVIDDCDNRPRLVTLGVKDEWVHHGTVPQLKKKCGYDVDAIVVAAEKLNNAQQ